MKKFAYLLIFAWSSFKFACPAQAQSFSLSISPPLLEVMMQPGRTVTSTYQLENGGADLTINPLILPFEPADELGNIRLLTSEVSRRRNTTSEVASQLTNWFSLQNADIALDSPFLLKSGEAKQIVLKISVPKEAKENDYYYTLLFQSVPEAGMAGFASRQAGTIGSNLLLTVSESGQPVKKGKIEEFKVQSSKFKVIDSFDKPEFLLRVKNTGKTLWKPFGKLRTEGLLGQKWEQEILPENVLANSLRQLKVSTPSASSASLFLLGPYKAVAEFNLEEDGKGMILFAETSFFALPLKFVFFLLTTLLIISIVKLAFKKIKLPSKSGT